MEFRNPVFNAIGTIDCEINHPVYGWVPFTADPNDYFEHGRDIYAAAIEAGPAPYQDQRTLDELKAEKNAAINESRLRANQSHFTFAGKQIAVDPLSRSDIDAAHGMILALQAMPPGWPGGWKAMDNTICAINDVPTWLAFYGAMVAQGTANFNHAQALKAQLAAATTPEEVEAIPVW